MFDTLIESKRKPDVKRGTSVGLFSLFMHSAVVAFAVYATARASAADQDTGVDTMVVFVSQQQEQKPPEPVALDIPLKGFQTVVAPTEIPTDIPPINLQEKFDPKDYTGTGVEGGVATGAAPDQVFMEAVVEEKPEVLSAAPPPYPEILKQAGIQGRVIVQAIIDTTGRAEPPSVKVVVSPNPGFDQPSKNYVLRALFRPARVHGRAVRVLVNVPIDFKIKR